MTNGLNVKAIMNYNPQNAGGNDWSVNPVGAAALVALLGGAAVGPRMGKVRTVSSTVVTAFSPQSTRITTIPANRDINEKSYELPDGQVITRGATLTNRAGKDGIPCTTTNTAQYEKFYSACQAPHTLMISQHDTSDTNLLCVRMDFTSGSGKVRLALSGTCALPGTIPQATAYGCLAAHGITYGVDELAQCAAQNKARFATDFSCMELHVDVTQADYVEMLCFFEGPTNPGIKIYSSPTVDAYELQPLHYTRSETEGLTFQPTAANCKNLDGRTVIAPSWVGASGTGLCTETQTFKVNDVEPDACTVDNSATWAPIDLATRADARAEQVKCSDAANPVKDPQVRPLAVWSK